MCWISPVWCPRRQCRTMQQTAKKRCVFCGSLYPGLREPGFALELFRALGPASGWTLTMAGGGWQYFAADAAQTKAVLGEQFEQPGPVPAETARAMQAQADVLLNLGNAVDNQLPSKLFDYFCCGQASFAPLRD